MAHMASNLEDQIASHTNSAKFCRLSGKENPVHKIPPSWGKRFPVADVFMWRDKKVSAVSLLLATVIWVLFESIKYHLVPLICHFLLIYILTVFIYNNTVEIMSITRFAPPPIPKISIPEEVIRNAAYFLSVKAILLSEIIIDILSARNPKKFVAVFACLSIVSEISSWCDGLTLLYVGFVISLTVPFLHHKYKDGIHRFGHTATVEKKKRYMEMKNRYMKISHKAAAEIRKLYRWCAEKVTRK